VLLFRSVENGLSFLIDGSGSVAVVPGQGQGSFRNTGPGDSCMSSAGCIALMAGVGSSKC